MNSSAVLLLVIVAVVAVAVVLFGRATKSRRATSLPYGTKSSLLTKTELDFFHSLQQATGNQVVICPMVRLADIFKVTAAKEAGRQGHFNRIQSKHVDFLLCEPATMKPLVGIELDDSSHQEPERQKRDGFVDSLYSAAGLPLLHFVAKGQSTPEKIAAQLAPHLGQTQTLPRTAVPQTASRSKPSQSPQIAQAPRCPKCGSELKICTAKNGEQFWGCPRYPSCSAKIPLGATAAQK